MLQTLFSQHFNGFILHRTFVVYHETCCIIFLKTSFSLWRNGVFLLFCCYQQAHHLKLPGYTAESSSSDSVFWSYLFTDLPLKTYKTSRFDITKEQRRLGWKCHTEISSPITGFQITHTRYTNTPHTNYYTYKLHIQVTQTLNKRSNIQR
jgi:hypothetical protein